MCVPCLLAESALLPFHAGLAPRGPWHCLWVSVPGGEPLHPQVGEHSLGRTCRQASTGSQCPAPYVYVLLHSSGWIPLNKVDKIRVIEAIRRGAAVNQAGKGLQFCQRFWSLSQGLHLCSLFGYSANGHNLVTEVFKALLVMNFI